MRRENVIYRQDFHCWITVSLPLSLSMWVKKAMPELGDSSPSAICCSASDLCDGNYLWHSKHSCGAWQFPLFFLRVSCRFLCCSIKQAMFKLSQGLRRYFSPKVLATDHKDLSLVLKPKQKSGATHSLSHVDPSWESLILCVQSVIL